MQDLLGLFVFIGLCVCALYFFLRKQARKNSDMRLASAAALERRDFRAVPAEVVRQYWDARPCNVRHSAAPVGTRQYFDEVEYKRYKVEPHILTFADFVHWQNKRVRSHGGWTAAR